MKKSIVILTLICIGYTMQAFVYITYPTSSMHTMSAPITSTISYECAYIDNDLFIFHYNDDMIVSYYLIQSENKPQANVESIITNVSLEDNGKSIIIHYNDTAYTKYSIDASASKNTFKCYGISINENSSGLTKEKIFAMYR